MDAPAQLDPLARRRRWLPWAVGGLLVIGFFASLALGSYRTDVSTLFGWLPGIESGDATAEVIVRDIRLPRVLLAALVGAALAASGAALQGLFRNPLADPGLIGVASGGAVGALLTLVFFSATVPLVLQIWIQPIGALAGALGVTLLAWQIARRAGRTDVAALLLAGIALNALAAAIIGLTLTLADSQQLRSFVFWSLGSLAQADWPRLQVALLLIALPTLALLPFGRRLDVLQLGEEEAARLGVPVAFLTRGLVILTALAVGTAVALCGLIAFIGLVVPHLIRLSCGPQHRFLLPMSALGGACLLVWADLAARTVQAPAELPIGILTALVGAPFFLGLILYGKVGYTRGR